jgi:chromosome transmission fidelity protein 8
MNLADAFRIMTQRSTNHINLYTRSGEALCPGLVCIMTSIKLYPPTKDGAGSNPLPQLLQTPSGLAILELQGTINLPQNDQGEAVSGFEMGKLVFPDYDANADGTAWMKRVHMYIGQYQLLIGEVKKLPKAIAVVRRRDSADAAEASEDLEVVEIVKYKLMFSNRPEPVGTAHAPSGP